MAGSGTPIRAASGKGFWKAFFVLFGLGGLYWGAGYTGVHSFSSILHIMLILVAGAMTGILAGLWQRS